MRVAIYARVSSDRQEREETIQSQLTELRTRAKADDMVDWRELTDEGYSRDDLVRPSLDRLRDLAAEREIERLYVQCPDRLASGAKLMLLVEEFQQQKVEVVFLKGSFDDTPEGKLMLHMQGAIAEYERTKIAERTRRGKLYWAKHGALVGGHAPYGYCFVPRTDTVRAHLKVDDIQAVVVRDIYRWLVEEGMSTRSIAMRLTELDVPRARGANQWQPTTVDRILRNPVYRGQFHYCKYERIVPAKRRSTDPYRQHRKSGRKLRPQDEWIPISVPAIVDEAIWERAQQQLGQNSLYSRRNNKRHSYLLRGLIRCPRCGSTYVGAAKNERRTYHCGRADASLSSTGKKCSPGSFSADMVEQVVWQAVKEALQQPELLVAEYRRRLEQSGTPEAFQEERRKAGLALKHVMGQEDRITDAYVNEAMDLGRYKAEMEKLGRRRKELERANQELDQRERRESEGRKALGHLERFCHEVCRGLDALTFEERQQLLRLVIERIMVQDGRVRIETILPTTQEGKLRTHHPEHSEGSAVRCSIMRLGFFGSSRPVGTPSRMTK